MTQSQLVCAADGGITLSLSVGARCLGCWAKRKLVLRADEIVGVWRSDARIVSGQLRWKIAGAALSRQRAMGWFSWVGHRRQWAWVWLTPDRNVVVIQTKRQRPALVVVPIDWCDAKWAEHIPTDSWKL